MKEPMGQRVFRPVFKRQCPAPPPFDPSRYPVPPDTDKQSFGDLFHEIYRFAVNMYDVTKHGPGHHKPAMEAVTNTVITFLIETAAWLDGQSMTAPDLDNVRAQLLDLRSQALHYEYGKDVESTIVHLMSSTNLWFIPRLHILQDKAYALKMEIRRGASRVRVTAEFELQLDTNPDDVKQYVKETVCKEMFAADSVQFLKLKKVEVITQDQTPTED